VDAAEWDDRYAASADLEWGAEPNRWVAGALADLPPGRALDLGCGEGRNALWLARRGWTVTAVDFSGTGIDKGRQLTGDLPVEWVVDDLLRYPVTPAAFDAVVVAYLHLYPRARRDVLRRAAEGLAPGGVLLVVGHDTTNLTDGVGGPREAAILFTPDDVVADLADLPGLGVERAEQVRRPVGDAEAIDALVVVRAPV
jgi:SAM-dependent methyltransferase